MKKYLSLILSLMIPIVSFILCTLFTKIYPFGDKILPMLDGYTQYPGFLNALKEFAFNHQSILYSFKGLTGFNLYAASVYYTFNITNLLFLLFKTSHIMDFYTLIIPIKMGLASLSMCIFLNYINKNKFNFMFSICYGLSAYNLLYYLNYMWFDSVILLPLVILGIEKMFKEKKGYLYTLFLTLSIIFNFYMGYMICIFSCIYFIYKWIMNNCKKEYLFRFIIYSLLSGLLSAFVLIPVVLELLKGKGLLFSNTNYFKFDLDFINVFYKLTIGSFLNGDLEYGTPNVYIGLFIYINSILFFFNKNIKLKEKIISGGIVLFFLLSMSFNLFDYFWQMLQMPIYYPVRYAYIFDFYLIYLAYRHYSNFKITSYKKIITTIIIIFLALIGFATSGNLLDRVNLSAKFIYLGISVLFILYYMFIIDNKDLRKYLWIVVVVELFANNIITFKNNGNSITINSFNNNYSSSVKAINKLNLDSFDRVSYANQTIKNNGLLLNYNSINYFSSVRNKKTLDVLANGFDINIYDGCSSNYYFANPITNSLLNIKYFITKEDISYYDLIDNDKNEIYLNKDVAGIGFITKDLSNLKLTNNYMDNINSLVKYINGDDKDIIIDTEITDKNVACTKKMCITYGNEPYITYDLFAKKDMFIYIKNDFPAPAKDTVYKIEYLGEEKKIENKYPFFLKKNDKIKITITPDKNFKDYYYHVYQINFDVYQKFINNIKENKLKITDYQNDANFKGIVTLVEDGYLYTSISNDDGWKILVDDKVAKVDALYDGLIGLKLNKGTHKISFNYSPPGLKLGLIISITTLLFILLYKLKNKQ